jgi:hypothetical protein
MDTREIVESLFDKLPEMAKHLIRNNLNSREELNREYFKNPDDPLQHRPEYHQWGVITHTKMFDTYNQEEVPGYLQQWGVDEAVSVHMSESIDGRSKKELLEIAIPLHDLGKFSDRRIVRKPNKPMHFIHAGHEKTSGGIIRSEGFSQILKRDYQLTDAQIEYVARCAELHYELAKVRDSAKNRPDGYSMAFVQTDDFKQASEKVMAGQPGFEPEMGLLYLGDSLAKTEIHLSAESDADILSQEDDVKRMIEERGITTGLQAIRQLPVNVNAVREYLKLWNDKQQVVE